MNQEILKGQKITLDQLKFNIGINWNQGDHQNYEIDTSLMLLSDRNKLEEEENFIFYNNLKSRCGGVELKAQASGGYKKNFTINLEKISSDASRLMLILTIDNGDKLNQRFGNIKEIEIDLLSENSKEILYKYRVDGLTSETALILAEIYKHNNEWKLKAVGNGFNAGLDKILEEYGSDKVKVKDEQAPAKDITKAENKPPEHSGITLTKITLEKKGDVTKINLSKTKKIDKIYVKLSWKKGVDLDLHAFYKNKVGKTGHVYFSSKGNLNQEPFLMLDKDSGVGNTAGDNEENLTIADLKYFDYILFSVNIFRFFSRKGENFAKYDGRVELETDRGDKIKVPLTSEEIGTWCVIAMIDNTNADEPRIVNINQVLKNEPVISDFQSL